MFVEELRETLRIKTSCSIPDGMYLRLKKTRVKTKDAILIQLDDQYKNGGKQTLWPNRPPDSPPEVATRVMMMMLLMTNFDDNIGDDGSLRW